ncbi:hypothetical protein Thiosp_04436 [Thiorhodovibrio litoralis]|nr:hypothetical protein Thiosp_04436 [Thiorhodovibrio litoralis]
MDRFCSLMNQRINIGVRQTEHLGFDMCDLTQFVYRFHKILVYIIYFQAKSVLHICAI